MLDSLAMCAIALASVQTYRQRHPLPDLTVPNGWGVNIHFNDPQPGEMEMIANAGFRWIRQDLSWHAVEREKGKYDFEPLARLFRACEANGIRPLIILDYGNDLYQQGSPRTPEARTGFCRMVEALMERFKGRGAIWEMWNEPNIHFWQPSPNAEEYIALAKEVGKTIRRVAPDEFYVGPATSGFDWPFLQECFDAGLLEYWDAVTVHPYRQSEPESVAWDWGKLRALVDAHRPKGKIVALLSGEWGYSELYSAMDQEKQGQFIARQYLSNLASDVGLSIWYDWKDDGADPKEVEHHFGTVSPELKPKPAYEAAKALSAALEGYTFHLRLAQKSPKDLLMAFRKGQEVKYAGWTIDSKPTRLRLPHGEMMTVAGTPKVVEAPRGAARDLVLTWRSLPTVLSVGSEVEAAEATALLKRNLPPGALLQVPTIVDRPDLAERSVRVRVAKGPVALEQDVLLVQPKPLTLRLLAREGRALVVLENPGGRKLDGIVGVRQGTIKEELKVRLSPDEKIAILPTRFQTSLGPVSVALVEAPYPRVGVVHPDQARTIRTLAQLPPTTLQPIEIAPDLVEVAADGDPKLVATYRLDFGRENVLTYEFPVGWKFLMVRPKGEYSEPLPGRPSHLTMMVRGDGSGDYLRMRFTDSTGQTFQPDAGTVNWEGWRPVTFRLDASAAGRWGGANDGVVHYPIRLETILLVDNYAGGGGKGEVAFRDVTLVASSAKG